MLDPTYSRPPATPSSQSEISLGRASLVLTESETMVCELFSSIASSSSAHEAKNNGEDTVSHRADTRKATFRTLMCAEGRSV